jgi:valyl-tRNA synthetase
MLLDEIYIPVEVLCVMTLSSRAGTGCVKITPAHDPNDLEVGRRHGLSVRPCYGEDGFVNNEGGSRFHGMRRFDAREAVVQALKV